MTYNKLLDALRATGYPVTEGVFPASEKPEPPYITVEKTSETAFYADGVAYYAFSSLAINLYTAGKDAVAETRLRSALSGTGYKWAEARNASQSCYAYTITMEV